MNSRSTKHYLLLKRAFAVSSPPGRSPQREVAGNVFCGLVAHNKRLGLQEIYLSETLPHVSSELPELPESPEQKRGVTGVCFRFSSQCIVLHLSGGHVPWDYRIVIDRVGLFRHIISGVAEHHHRLGLCRNVASGVADRHNLGNVPERRSWGR